MAVATATGAARKQAKAVARLVGAMAAAVAAASDDSHRLMEMTATALQLPTAPGFRWLPGHFDPAAQRALLAEVLAIVSSRERDVLAVTRNPAPGSMLLTGHAEMVPEGKDHALLKVAWSLTQADGLTTGTFRSQQTVPIIPGEDPYQRLSASAMMPFASRVAFQAADLVINPPKPVQVASATDLAAPPSEDAGPAPAPISGLPPAPRPRVSSWPIESLISASQACRAWASVLTATNSTPRIPASTIRLTALVPPPPAPTTFITAR